MMSGDVFSALNSASAKYFHQESEVLNPIPSPISKPVVAKKRRNLPGTPDPDAEVIALSPTTLMATNRFICEICNKGFKRDQNLQLHRRGHNLPWKLKQKANKDQIKKKVYLCPEKTCVHHDPARALGDLTGIKKHFSRKHGEKKWKCDKKYAVQSDLKAHSKTCGTREYKCDCGTLFSRKDSFITHRAFCDALAEENSRIPIGCGVNDQNFRNDLKSPNLINIRPNLPTGYATSAGGFRPEFTSTAAAGNSLFMDQDQQKPRLSLWLDHNPNIFMPSSSSNFPEMVSMTSSDIFGLNSSVGNYANLSLSPLPAPPSLEEEPAIISKGNSNTIVDSMDSLYSDQNQIHHSNYSSSSGSMSATALLQKAAQMGPTKSNPQFFGNTIGVMFNSSSSSKNRCESYHQFLISKQPENIIAGSAMNFSASMASNTINNSDPSMIQTQGSNSLILHGVGHSLTRDFLGMGGDGGEIGPFLPQELAKFASTKSDMGMSHFTNNNQ